MTYYSKKGDHGFSSSKASVDQENPPENATQRDWSFADKEGTVFEFQRDELNFIEIESAEIISAEQLGQFADFDELHITGMIAAGGIGKKVIQSEVATLVIPVDMKAGGSIKPNPDFLAFCMICGNYNPELPFSACVYVGPEETFTNSEGKEITFKRKSMWFKQSGPKGKGMEKKFPKMNNFKQGDKKYDPVVAKTCEEYGGCKFYYEGLTPPEKKDARGKITFDYEAAENELWEEAKKFCELIKEIDKAAPAEGSSESEEDLF